ncbi:MAG: type IX secretion system membrane protein PorP/SprF [Bacteroidia bacterium]|nr:type IX secretion system membrane protein PorP/SprF [Bacteroidia bacterium]
MKNRILYIALCFCLVFIAKAQQLPQYTQYMLNQMAINPAYAGTEEFPEVRSNNRQQWVGITDAPRTYMLTLNGPIKAKHMGIGMGVYTDIVGPTRRTGINASYAYHLKLQEDMTLSMGLTAGILQWGIDGNKLTIREEDDPSLSNVYQTTIVPDFGAGLYFRKAKQFYVGISIPQIYQAPIGLYDASKESRVVSHFNINGAYSYSLNEQFVIEPSFLLKYVKPASPILDIGARVIYKDELWAGLTYRTKDAVSFLVGYMFKNYLMIGYSYDFTTSNVRKYSSGTHEIMLGIRFSRKQAATWGRPSQN